MGPWSYTTRWARWRKRVYPNLTWKEIYVQEEGFKGTIQNKFPSPKINTLMDTYKESYYAISLVKWDEYFGHRLYRRQ